MSLITLSAMKIALIHDWLNQNGGAELVLEELLDLYPEATIFTSLYDRRVMPPHYAEWDIRTSFLQRIPGAAGHHQALLPFYPRAFERFDLSGYDLIISNSSAFAHLVKPGPNAVHINYCLTPPRFLWNLDTYVQRESLWPGGTTALRPLIRYLREKDVRARDRVHYFVGISNAVVERIRRIYGQPAACIFPPVETGRFKISSTNDDYYLVVSRLVPYKRIDLAVEAMNRLGRRLVVVGDGRDLSKLRALAGPTVEFTGRLSEPEVNELVCRCRAFLFPGNEDFGIAPVEAQAAGRPVVAFAAGGALDTVTDGETGVTFAEATVDSMVEAILRLDAMQLDPETIRRHALRFDTNVFRERISAFVSGCLASSLPVTA